MRIYLSFFLVFLTYSVVASEDGKIRDLFIKYDLIMKHHKVELVDEVFTKKFLAGGGGKAEFIEKVKELPRDTNKSLAPQKLSIKKGTVNSIYFVQFAPAVMPKSTDSAHHGSQFIVSEEDGKLKIDGTLSDAE